MTVVYQRSATASMDATTASTARSGRDHRPSWSASDGAAIQASLAAVVPFGLPGPVQQAGFRVARASTLQTSWALSQARQGPELPHGPNRASWRGERLTPW